MNEKPVGSKCRIIQGHKTQNKKYSKCITMQKLFVPKDYDKNTTKITNKMYFCLNLLQQKNTIFNCQFYH